MKKWKSILAILTAVLTMTIMTACGGGDSSSSDADTEGQGAGAVFATQDLSDCCTVSKAEGYFEEFMPDIDIETFNAGRDINNALKAQSADFGGAFGIVPVSVGLTSGIDYKVIYIATRIQGTEGLVVKEDSGVETVADLKGKKIGYTSASSGHYGLLCALQDEGLTVDDVELIDMDPDAINSAWQRGDIDVAYTWNPTLINLKNTGGKVILTVEDLAKNGHATYNFYVVRSDYAEANPDQVVAFIKGVAKGAQLYKDDPDTAKAAAAERLELSVDEINEQMTDIYPTLDEQMSDECFGNDNAAQNLYDVAQFLKDAGQIDDAKDLEFFKSMIDTSYIEQALAEMEE